MPPVSNSRQSATGPERAGCRPPSRSPPTGPTEWSRWRESGHAPDNWATRSSSPGRSQLLRVAAASPPIVVEEQATPPPGTMLVPIEAWDKMLHQLGNLHEAGQQLAEARERAARAETEAAFLRERLAEMRAAPSQEPATAPVQDESPIPAEPEPAHAGQDAEIQRLSVADGGLGPQPEIGTSQRQSSSSFSKSGHAAISTPWFSGEARVHHSGARESSAIRPPAAKAAATRASA